MQEDVFKEQVNENDSRLKEMGENCLKQINVNLHLQQERFQNMFEKDKQKSDAKIHELIKGMEQYKIDPNMFRLFDNDSRLKELGESCLEQPKLNFDPINRLIDSNNRMQMLYSENLTRCATQGLRIKIEIINDAKI